MATPTHRVRLLASALAAVAAGEASAQFPDVLSATECAGCAAALRAVTRFEGIWSSPLTSAEDPTWTIADFFCVAACTAAARASATASLEDPANARRPTLELYEETVHANAREAVAHMTAAARTALPQPHEPTRSPRFSCDPVGFAEQVVSPLPLEVGRHPGGFALRYEEFGATRVVALEGDARPHSTHHHPFGVSTGRLENGVLIIDTTGIPAGRLYDWFGGGPHSDELRATERYSTSEDGDWLFLELRLEDPQTFSKPLVLLKRWRREPGARIARQLCDVMSGQLENVFADYVDVRTLDRRRGL